MILPNSDSSPKKRGGKPVRLSRFKKKKSSQLVKSKGLSMSYPFVRGLTVVSNYDNILASNDEIFLKPAPIKTGGGGGGEPPKGEVRTILEQDRCPDLKSWLQAYGNIKNNVCPLDTSPEDYIRRTKNSERQRLTKDGSTSRRIKPAKDWHRTMSGFQGNPIRGWWGGKPPTVDELINLSRVIDERLSPWSLDLETLSFIRNNPDKKFLINPLQNCERVAEMDKAEYALPYPICPTSGLEATSNSDWVILDAVYVDHLVEQYGAFNSVLPQPVVQTNKSMCLITETPQAIMKRSIREKNKQVDSVSEDRQRYLNTQTNLRVNDSHSELPTYKVINFSEATIEDEIAYEMGRILNREVEDISSNYLSPICSDPMAEEDSELIRYQAYWEDYLRKPKKGYKFWKKFMNGHSNCFSCIGLGEEPLLKRDDDKWYELYWEQADQSAQYGIWLANRAVPCPEIKTIIQGNKPGIIRWNNYVMQFFRYTRGLCSKEILEAKAKHLWDTAFKKTDHIEAYNKWVEPFNETKEDTVLEGEYLPCTEDKPTKAPYYDEYFHSTPVTPVTKTEYTEKDIVRTLATNAINRVKNETEEKIMLDVPSAGKEDMSFLCLRQAHKKLTNGLLVKMDEYEVVVNGKTYYYAAQ